MKTVYPFAILLLLLSGCSSSTLTTTEDSMEEKLGLSPEISVKSPTPSKQISKVSLSSEQRALVPVCNDFAVKLLDLLNSENNEGSFVISPLSISLDLAMVANGTSGQAREEILQAFNYHDEDLSGYNSLCKTLMEELPAVDLSSTLKIANALFVNDSYPVKESFQKMMGETYYGAVESLPFSQTSFVLDRINKWVSESTEGRIPVMLKKIESETIAFLINALYFQAKLRTPFNPKSTYSDCFHAPDEDVITDFMQMQLPIPYESNEVSSSISLPLGNGMYSMSIFLPHEEYDIEDVIDQLKNNDNMARSQQIVEIHLPKFETESSFHLPSVLTSLGISSIFGLSDFEPMLECPITIMRVSDLLHKANISVDEYGIEASAATAVTIMASAPATKPKVYEFFADRPFVYMIREKSSGVILFSGIFRG